ncbi:thioredoxin domain-containing protein 9 [Diabrotica virgifera virgifera]|uniref:Thioredoxin domain-containing protein 9 n=1 Tax=Diabrotica virgifera virgifera TaxID=50390 RepID=A0A6P7FIW5_DIAVI|nr:thioredoxin domain-containing protein 9 [Diabrotica virgifera virgifera]
MDAVENNLLRVTQAIEKQVDAVIDQIDNLDTNDLEQLKINRIKELKKLEEQKKIWLSRDHGKYEELAEEKMFFDLIKKSENVIIHFYRDSTLRCKIVDKHLKILAPKHIETRFTKLDAEKCPFLVEKLKVKTLPTIVLIQNGVMVDKIVGFSQLGNTDEFTTDILEWRIAQNGVIKYEGDLSIPPDHTEEKKKIFKTIRSRNDDDDDDLDIEEYGIMRESAKSETRLKNDIPELTPEEAAELGID